LSNILKNTQQNDVPVLIKTPEIIAVAASPKEPKEDEYQRLTRSRDSLEEFRQEIENMHVRAQEEIKKPKLKQEKFWARRKAKRNF